ncbi:MAG: OmpH family outer membrane protein, partial [Acidobacteria bacterium]|nr:OmpH family outer membrane protein [Acidobacteriota bacterium]
MKKHFLCALLFIVMALMAMSASASAQTPAATDAKTKIGIIEIAAFRVEIGELKVKYEKLQTEFAPLQRELENIAASIEAKQKTLQEGKNLTPQQAAKLQGDIQGLQKEAQRKQEDGAATAGKREQEETGTTYEKISKFLEQYCTQKGITQVLEAGKLRESGLV